MTRFNVKPPVNISYFDHNEGGLIRSIRNSAGRRGMNPLRFIFRKILNTCLYRISYFCPLNSIRVRCHKWRGVNIGKNVYIGSQCSIDNAYPEYVYINDNVSIAPECFIVAHSNPYSHFNKVTSSMVSPVIIEQGAWICARSLVLPGVIIGENAIVSAGSVIDKNLPARSVAAGNPARIIAEKLPID
jgi:acetyltransferase-like isoleucine patch superfamily enzyme